MSKAAAVAVCACLWAVGAEAQEEHVHEDGSAHLHEGLHFTHPLIAESVTPDTKIRVDYQWFDFPDGDTESSTVLGVSAHERRVLRRQAQGFTLLALLTVSRGSQSVVDDKEKGAARAPFSARHPRRAIGGSRGVMAL